MSKKEILVLFVLVVFLSVSVLYTTKAYDISSNKAGTTESDVAYNFDFNILVNVQKEVTVHSGTTKVFDYNITNTSAGTIQYAVVYRMIDPTTKPQDFIIGKSPVSSSAASGLIATNETKNIGIVLVNNTAADVTVKIETATGYENGGDIILKEGQTMLETVTNEEYYNDLDTTGANIPKLVGGMIPVYYDSSVNTWKKADEFNQNSRYEWYDYGDKHWANVVLVTEATRNSYMVANAGYSINPNDILAFYVWIPRFKYQTWNVSKTIGSSSYDAKSNGVGISFENGTSKTGTDVTCSINSSTKLETCTGSGYYTHPAFTLGTTELTGFWVAKFETSGTTGSPRVLPNATSLASTTVSSQKSASELFATTSFLNTGGINNIDSHLIKSMEWGAIAYLTNSNYGRCTNNFCSELLINNTTTTGGGDYITNVNQSTTGNVYGVYDMSGGLTESTAGVSYESNNSSIYYSNSGLSSYEKKYLNLYAYGTTNNDSNAYNRGLLGEATAEVIVSSGTSWYTQAATMPGHITIQLIPRGISWMSRGTDGIFSFSGHDGSASASIGFRNILS